MVEPLRSQVSDTMLTFLSSVGVRSETEMYLRLFRGMPRGRFALVAPTGPVLRESVGTLAEQLALLRQLGLTVSIAVGSTEPAAPEEVGWLMDALDDVELSPRLAVVDGYGSDHGLSLLETADQWHNAGQLPVFLFKGDREAQLDHLVRQLQPRKLIFLRAGGGLGPHGGHRVEIAPGHFLLAHDSGLAVINLRSDQGPLEASGLLSAEEKQWLGRCRQLLGVLADVGAHQSTVAIASPLSLLRELFTVRGEGTLIKLGSHIAKYEGLTGASHQRLEQLLDESFAKKIQSSFFERPALRLYLEEDYRGVAVVEDGAHAAYLSKFAVLPVARGEGLGQELWWAMSRDLPALYWRSRSDNPINSWYTTVCDGLYRFNKWYVFWRGVEPERLPALIADALARPEDFAHSSP